MLIIVTTCTLDELECDYPPLKNHLMGIKAKRKNLEREEHNNMEKLYSWLMEFCLVRF